MYYEDVDLCFRARELGMRVIYEPRATVIHDEGGTAGTDSRRLQRFQEANRRFVDAWRHRRASISGPGSAIGVRVQPPRGPRVLILDHRVPLWDRDADPSGCAR